MRKFYSFFFILLLVGCVSVDITPTFYGNYNIGYKITETKNGTQTKSADGSGVISVSAGTQPKTLNINDFQDNDGNTINFKASLGKYSFTEKYNQQNCEVKRTIAGTISQSEIYIKQTVEAKCGNDVLIGILEGRGVK